MFAGIYVAGSPQSEVCLPLLSFLRLTEMSEHQEVYLSDFQDFQDSFIAPSQPLYDDLLWDTGCFSISQDTYGKAYEAESGPPGEHSPRVEPAIALQDPTLTQDTGSWIFATQGLDSPEFTPHPGLRRLGRAKNPATRSEASRDGDDSYRSCRVCNSRFARAELLEQHAKSSLHATFWCDLCRKGFCRQDSYFRHRSAHTNADAHCCPVCSRTFARKDYLWKHLRNVHAQSSSDWDLIKYGDFPQTRSLPSTSCSRCSSPALPPEDRNYVDSGIDSDSGYDNLLSSSCNYSPTSANGKAGTFKSQAVADIVHHLSGILGDDHPAFREVQQRFYLYNSSTTEQLAQNLARLTVDNNNGGASLYLAPSNPRASKRKAG